MDGKRISGALALLLLQLLVGDALRTAGAPPAAPEIPVAVAAPRPLAQPSARGGPANPDAAAPDLLAARHLVVPVQGVAPARLHDTFEDARSRGRSHKAIDIMAAWGTPVLAADDGRLEKISSNAGGGLAVYQSDPTGRFVYYYAHLAGYADGLREGQALHRGDVIGYVGTTGNAPKTAPHLHFAVMLLERRGRWWGGEALNPYAALAQGQTVVAGPP